MLNSLFILFLFFSQGNLWSQMDYEFNGYVLEMPMALKPSLPIRDNDYQFSNLTRLRLRPSLFFSSDARITMHYEMNYFLTNNSVINLIDGGVSNRQAVSLSKEFYNSDKSKAKHFIDLLYYKHTFDDMEIVLGRQIISWGSGRIWQPTDMFNPINPANFAKIERDGTDAASMKYFLGDFTDIEILYNFREKWREGNYAMRFRTNVSEYDIALMTGKFDERLVVGMDFAGNFFDTGVRGEVLISGKKDNIKSNFTKVILGIDYQFNKDLYGLLEYHYNGEGYKKFEHYQLHRLALGEIQNLNIHYIATQATYKLTPLLNLSLGTNININDGSGYVRSIVDYSLFEDLTLKAGVISNFGEQKSEYKSRGNAIYFIAEYFF